MADSSPLARRPSRTWALPLALAIVLALLAAWRLWPSGADQSPGPPPRAAVGEFAFVELDNAHEATATARVPWESGTVLDLLRLAGDADPAFKPRVVGQGEMAMVTAIGGRQNEGAEGRNWLYEVNGQFGQVGAGAARVRPGDRVLWKFAVRE